MSEACPKKINNKNNEVSLISDTLGHFRTQFSRHVHSDTDTPPIGVSDVRDVRLVYFEGLLYVASQDAE